MVNLKAVIVSAALAFATLGRAQVDGFTHDSFLVNWNVPASGDDLFVQISGETSKGWIATGIGSGMAGALIFIIYPAGNGNVTVSPRLGLGQFEPKYESSIKYELLSGSGVFDDTMMANIKCSNCRTWDGGSINVKSTSQNMIWAIGNQKGLSTTSQTTTLRQHSQNGYYDIDLVSATGGDSGNPFEVVTVDGTTTVTSGGATATAKPKSSSARPRTKADKVIIAHGVIMGVTFVLLFPFGAALIRLLNNRIPNAFALHRGVQTLNFLLAVTGLALGVYRSKLSRSHFQVFHQFFGVIIVGLLLVQGVLGGLHHATYLKTQKRSLWSYAHIWLGRGVIIAGIINGGLGLDLPKAKAPKSALVAYSVVAAVVVAAYGAFYMLKKRSPEESNTPSTDVNTHMPYYEPVSAQQQPGSPDHDVPVRNCGPI